MHWSNGNFHGPVTVKDYVYVTGNKHIAIFGTIDYTQFGEPETASRLYGKSVNVKGHNGAVEIEAAGTSSDVIIKGQRDITGSTTSGSIGLTAATSFSANANAGVAEVIANGSDNKARLISNGGGVEITGNKDISIISNTGEINIITKTSAKKIALNAASAGVDITAGDGDVALNASDYVKILPGLGVILNESAYGTTLPSTGVPGQAFFKLIS